MLAELILNYFSSQPLEKSEFAKTYFTVPISDCLINLSADHQHASSGKNITKSKNAESLHAVYFRDTL